MKINCTNCGKEVEKTPSELKRSKTGNLYCSKSCAVTNNNKLFKFGDKHPNYKNGNGSYRNLKIRSSKMECENCKNTDSRVLQVYHRDGNRKNNKLDNLKLLCANCHLIEHSENVV